MVKPTKIELDVTLTKGAGAAEAYILIDRKGVLIGSDNKGIAKVEADDPLHDIQVVVKGQYPSSCEYKVMQGAVQVAGGALTVSFGKRTAGYVDEFAHV